MWCCWPPLRVSARCTWPRCIEANKHVFCEKPIATDAFGVRSVLQTTEKAAAKNLNLVSGFCWRYNNMIQETFEQMEKGAIGKTHRVLRHLLYEPGETNARGQHPARGHERRRVADPQLV